MGRVSGPPVRHGLARILSKQGVCSRTEAARWVLAGRISVDGRVVRDPEFPVVRDRHRICVDGHDLQSPAPVYLMLNKPRGQVTTVRDEQGRDTVYRCFDGAQLPWVAPVGRLDKASEGLLLFSNDTGWASRITDPASGPDKTYHVQVGGQPDAAVLEALVAGIDDSGEHLAARSVRVLRLGSRNAWLEVVLDEGRNRQIRRLLAAFQLPVLRLVRVAIGELAIGDLGKGGWRELSREETEALARPTR
ncbi:pseudouridine synthase [Marilutibacter chinensis]|uniref:Pseudouridine synthase n=1 Tax=Marilutibacter chinensis TaxID=2912247 RepID=A0ABS9HW93_9GAMM|nr:pseudouridine synthase [Lysobacter chinensis]MCF7221276.1 rRNA pseudouridine synthase [Lysobacter chinensis]MCF7222983.1 rRNA pseudouridine synthase [Lysobacter chinensis]